MERELIQAHEKRVYMCVKCGSTLITWTKVTGYLPTHHPCLFSGRKCAGNLRLLKVTHPMIRADWQWVGAAGGNLLLRKWRRTEEMTAGAAAAFTTYWKELVASGKAEVTELLAKEGQP